MAKKKELPKAPAETGSPAPTAEVNTEEPAKVSGEIKVNIELTPEFQAELEKIKADVEAAKAKSDALIVEKDSQIQDRDQQIAAMQVQIVAFQETAPVAPISSRAHDFEAALKTIGASGNKAILKSFYDFGYSDGAGL